MATVDDMISQAQEVATDKAEAAQDFAESAQTAAQTVTSLTPALTVVAPTFDIPAYNPDVRLAETFNSDFDAIWADMEGWVRGLMTDYLNNYFPVLDTGIQQSEDDWLLSVVDDGYIGIPATVETQIWDKARAKETQEALRMEDEALEQFSARGFSIPPGALTGRLLLVQQEAANKSSTIARDVAIKQVEISVDMVKFAIGQMTALRLGIAQALADFIRAWMALPTAAAEIAKAKAELNRQLWDSSAAYINALVNYHGLDLEAQKANQLMTENNTRSFVELVNSNTNARVNAAISAADAMGKIAAAAMSSQNTLASVGELTTTSS